MAAATPGPRSPVFPRTRAGFGPAPEHSALRPNRADPPAPCRGRLWVASTAVYRPRHPERSSFYRIFEQRFDEYVGTYEERFEPRSGPLHPVVSRTVAAYLDCGRLFNGFARIRCPSCRGEHLLAFSCQTRNFCPSCQAKRAARFAEKLFEEIAAPVAHRHLVFTIPKALRGLFQRERTLLGLLSRCAYDAVRRAFATYLEDRHAVPGFVASIQTFGSFAANFHPLCEASHKGRHVKRFVM